MDDRISAPRFEPLQPASNRRLLLAAATGVLAWVAALAVAGVVVARSRVIELGLLVALVAFVASVLLLLVLYAARRREERTRADGG